MSTWNTDGDASNSVAGGVVSDGLSDPSWPDPPDLAQRSATPAYDANDLVSLLGVAPNILLGWEQSLGIPRPIHVPDEQGSLVPRYSERDLVAALWLRDQIRAGMSPVAAARRLISAQQPLPQIHAPSSSTAPTAPPQWGGPSDSLERANPTSGVFPVAIPSLRGHSGAFGPVSRAGPASAPLLLGPGQAGPGMPPPGPPSGSLGRLSGSLARDQSRPLGPPSGPLRPNPVTGAPSGPLGYRQTSGPLRRESMTGAPSGPLGYRQTSGPLGRTSGPLGRVSGPLGSPPGPSSGPLGRGAVTAVFPPGSTTPPPPNLSWRNATSSTGGLTTGGNLHMYQSALLNAFAALDPNETQRILDEALTGHSIEAVCMSLFQPLAIRSAELVAAGRLTPVAEQFGSLMVRNRLVAVLDSLPVNPAAPLALVACAPGEFHELGPLMVAICWRRAGVRTVYLGPNVAEDTIIGLARAHWQALVCLSAATDAGARQIGRLAAAISRTELPRPLLGYGGGAFVRSPELQRHVKDSYFLGIDAHMATRHVVQLLTQGPVKAR